MFRSACWFSLLVLLAAPAPASVLGTLSQPEAGTDVVSYNTAKAQSFSLSPAAGAYLLRRVTLHLRQVVPNAQLQLHITGSSGGLPDPSDVRAIFQVPASLPTGIAAPAVFTVAASPSPLLQPGQTYWLLLRIAALDHDQPLPAGLVEWSYAPSSAPDAPSATGWALGTRTASSGTAGADWIASDNTPYLFALEARPPGAAVPSAPFLLQSVAGFTAGAVGTPGVAYEVQVSSDLSAWTAGGTAFADAAGVIRFEDPLRLARRFYRFQ